jgi:hypothetical protein
MLIIISLEESNLTRVSILEPSSWTPGHLHRLEADDGKIYHYLQYGDVKAAFLGNGTHFKNIEVKARVFPGQFLLVEKGKLLP